MDKFSCRFGGVDKVTKAFQVQIFHRGSCWDDRLLQGGWPFANMPPTLCGICSNVDDLEHACGLLPRWQTKLYTSSAKLGYSRDRHIISYHGVSISMDLPAEPKTKRLAPVPQGSITQGCSTTQRRALDCRRSGQKNKHLVERFGGKAFASLGTNLNACSDPKSPRFQDL